MSRVELQTDSPLMLSTLSASIMEALKEQDGDQVIMDLAVVLGIMSHISDVEYSSLLDLVSELENVTEAMSKEVKEQVEAQVFGTVH